LNRHRPRKEKALAVARIVQTCECEFIAPFDALEHDV
jgi:hypothetical protein